MPKGFTCSKCGMGFKTEDEMKKHVLKEHQSKAQDAPKKRSSCGC